MVCKLADVVTERSCTLLVCGDLVSMKLIQKTSKHLG